MALLLVIDTSSKNCSVSLVQEKEELAGRTAFETRSHAQLLPVFIQEVFAESNKSPEDLDAIAVSAGPGSYTGLRIGMSTAKGLAYTLSIPLIAMDSLETLAACMLATQDDKEGIYIATLDSRKGEIYFAAMTGDGKIIHPSQPAVVAELDWDKWQGKSVYIAGNTAHKLQNSELALILIPVEIQYQAKNYINLAYNRFKDNTFDNLVYKEPNYLKPFQ